MRVFVYFNLHNGRWSIKALSGRFKGCVIAHAREVMLRDVTYKVSEAGRQRVLQEQRKNVHAGVVGTLEAFKGETRTIRGCIMPVEVEMYNTFGADDRAYRAFAKKHGDRVTYNPYRGPHFERITHNAGDECRFAIHNGDMAYLSTTGRTVIDFDPCVMP